MTIYASEQVHMSIPKAADMLGFGRDQVRIVACDERFRLDVRALARTFGAGSPEWLETILCGGKCRNREHRSHGSIGDIAKVAREFDFGFMSTERTALRPVLMRASDPLFIGTRAGRFCFARSAQVAVCSARRRLSLVSR